MREMAKCFSIKILFVLININVLFGVTRAQGSHKTDDEHKLFKDLFDGYNANVRPVVNKSDAITVLFDMAYTQLINLDSKQQVLASKVWLRQEWRNPFLAWDPKNYSGLTSINVDPTLIWKPDIILYNNIGYGKTGAIYNFDTKAQIDHNWTTSWYAPTEIHSICEINIKYFPFDEQKCIMHFGSWTYTGKQLNFINKNSSADITNYTPSGEWELLSANLKRNVVPYSCCVDPFIDITYTIHVQRRVLFYIMNLVVPCVVLSVLTIFTFYLPPESGERIGLGITILLGLTVFLLVFTENVPRTSEVTPLVGKYAFTVLIEVLVALIVTCGVLRVYHKDPEREMPRWLRSFLFDILGPMLLAIPSAKRADLKRAAKNKRFTLLSKTQGQPYEMHSPVQTLVSVHSRNTNRNNEHGSLFRTSSVDSHVTHSISDDRMDEIVLSMRYIIEHLKEQKDSDEKMNQWHLAAAVLDIFFFWITAITMLGSTLAFYFMIPSR